MLCVNKVETSLVMLVVLISVIVEFVVKGRTGSSLRKSKVLSHCTENNTDISRNTKEKRHTSRGLKQGELRSYLESKSLRNILVYFRFS